MSRSHRFLPLVPLVWMIAAAALAQDADDPLYTWRDALERHQEAGAHVGKWELTRAREVLEKAAAELRPPYDEMARRNVMEVRTLEHRYGEANDDPDHRKLACGPLGELCFKLHAHAEAVEFAELYDEARNGTRPPFPYLQFLPWSLEQLGKTEEAIAYLDGLKSLYSGASWGERLEEYKATVRSLDALPANLRENLAHVERARYGYWHNPTLRALPVLSRLARLLEEVSDADDRTAIYASIFRVLVEIQDEKGLQAWEDHLLVEVDHQGDTAAWVVAERGGRAYGKKQLDEAVRQFRLVCEKYPESPSYGISQFNLGYILKEQEKYEEAIAELEKLFPSNVNDKDPGGDIMTPYRNYRHRAATEISACYEALEKYEKALEYAMLARDRYKHQSWCGTCSGSASRRIQERIDRLKKLAGK